VAFRHQLVDCTLNGASAYAKFRCQNRPMGKLIARMQGSTDNPTPQRVSNLLLTNGRFLSGLHFLSIYCNDKIVGKKYVSVKKEPNQAKKKDKLTVDCHYEIKYVTISASNSDIEVLATGSGMGQTHRKRLMQSI